MLAASNSVSADPWGLSPYVGVDAEIRYTDFKRGFGNNLFRHNFPQGNLYAGLQFNDYFGLEVGFEATKKLNRTRTVVPGEIVNGITVPAGNTIQYVSTSHIYGPHADIIGLYPIMPCYCVDL